MDVVRYSEAGKRDWDEFVCGCRNGTFLFRREYLGYHAQRFPDHSLLFAHKGRLIAVLPATARAGVLNSHAGLTFGGFLVGAEATTPTLLEALDSLLEYMGKSGLVRLVYKCIPWIYHTAPAEEDRYALFLKGARLVRRDVSSTVAQPNGYLYQERRRRGLKKALAAGVSVREADTFDEFWPILEENLGRAHGVRPVHSLAEITSLHARFPDNIRLFAAYCGTAMLAGVVVYEHQTVAHAQYTASTDEGRRVGALDLLFDWLLSERFCAKRYFDYGISTEEGGTVLNRGLIEYKEGFGARAVVHDFYELDVAGAR